jgi:ribosomal protein S18 acetylase RimI-like enzyme
MPETTEAEKGPHHEVAIEKALLSDADAIKKMVVAAYSKYIPRMGGQPPAPMTANYHAIIASLSQDVFVLRQQVDGKVVGSISLSDPGDGSLKVNNLVVDQTAQGRGYGKLLMGFAERVTCERGREALTLFTNEKMTENLVLYPKMGFLEVNRKVEDGYSRVYFRKTLSS